jgi:hypothetical protein
LSKQSWRRACASTRSDVMAPIPPFAPPLSGRSSMADQTVPWRLSTLYRPESCGQQASVTATVTPLGPAVKRIVRAGTDRVIREWALQQPRRQASAKWHRRAGRRPP